LVYNNYIETMKPSWIQHMASDVKLRVLHAEPDGNCLFHSVSLLLTGTQEHTTRLRLHAAIELLMNINSHRDTMEVGDFISSHERAISYIADLTRHQAYMPNTAAVLLAQITGRVIRVHMPDNTSPNMQTINGLTARPQHITQNRPIDIAWELCTHGYCTGREHMAQLTRLNHYVAVSTSATDTMGQSVGPAAGRDYTVAHAAHEWHEPGPAPDTRTHDTHTQQLLPNRPPLSATQAPPAPARVGAAAVQH
jgi:hypothetical protein